MNINQCSPFSQKPKVVIFDLCGTLMNSKKVDHDAINYTLALYHQAPWSITRQKKNKLKSMKENFPNFFGPDASDAYNTYLNYLLTHIEEIPFFDGAKEYLQLLKKHHIKTAIITNRDTSFVKDLQMHTEFIKNIKPLIDVIVTADEAGVTKPSKKIIDYTLKKLSLPLTCSKQDIVFVGDAFADMKVALDYPAIPVLLTITTADITEEFLKNNIDQIYLAASHYEIIDAFKQSRF